MKVQIAQNTIELPEPFVEGGEARIYKLNRQTVAKIYKLPSDPEIACDEAATTAARIRLVVAQRKLPLFPRDMPATVVAPLALVRDPASGFIIGYTMPFIPARSTLSDMHLVEKDDLRRDRQLMNIFLDLRNSVRTLHERGIVIGDFNDRNVLVTDKARAYLIDMDSTQFAPFRTKVFTPEFVDPHLCRLNPASDALHDALELTTMHTMESDWYAWWVMLFQAVFRVHPYGGVYKPSDKSKKLSPNERRLKEYRISVYHPEVRTFMPCRALESVPEILTKYFRLVFVDGLRMEPPDALFNTLQFGSEGMFDAALSVLTITQHISASPTQLTAKLIAEADRIVACGEYEGALQYLLIKGTTLYRNRTDLIGIKDATDMQFVIAGAQSAIVKGAQAVVMAEGWPSKIVIDLKPGMRAKTTLIAGTTSGVVFYDGAFKLLGGAAKPFVRVLDIESGIEPIEVWAEGEHLSVLYRQGGKLGYLVHHIVWDTTLFNAPYAYTLPDQIETVASYVTTERAWLLITTGTGALCTVFDLAKQSMVTHIEALFVQAPPWMKVVNGKCAIGKYLFSPEAVGVGRIDARSDGTVNFKTFTTAEQIMGVTLNACRQRLFAAFSNRLIELH